MLVVSIEPSLMKGIESRCLLKGIPLVAALCKRGGGECRAADEGRNQGYGDRFHDDMLTPAQREFCCTGCRLVEMPEPSYRGSCE